MSEWKARLLARQPNDAGSRSLVYVFAAADKVTAWKIAAQFTNRLNAGPFAGFELESVKQS